MDGEPAPSMLPQRSGVDAATAAFSTRAMSCADNPTLSPEELARQSQEGCLDSFEQLVRLYENHIYNFLRQLTRNPHDAEDLTQETFLKAFRNLPSYRPTMPFAPWLFVIARRTAVSHFRSAKQFEPLPTDTEAEDANPASALEHQDEERSLWRTVQTLKPKQAEAIWLCYAEGFSTAEIGRIMGINRVHVKVLLHRGRACLAQMLVKRGMPPSKSPRSAGGGSLKRALLKIVV